MSGGKIIAEGPTREILTNKELLEANSLELPYCLQGDPGSEAHFWHKH